jgi:hypothetical protein
LRNSRLDVPLSALTSTETESLGGKTQYKVRTICELIHARWRNWELRQVTVRGINKVHNVILWYALTNNILQGHRLLAAAQVA